MFKISDQILDVSHCNLQSTVSHDLPGGRLPFVHHSTAYISYNISKYLLDFHSRYRLHCCLYIVFLRAISLYVPILVAFLASWFPSHCSVSIW